MRTLELFEGAWVKFIDSSTGEIHLGKVVRRIDKEGEPFSEKNFEVWVPRSGNYSPELSEILFVYPKILIDFNPTRR